MSKVKDVVSSRTHKLAESWLSVRIETDVDNCKWVTIVSHIHLNQETLLPHCYSHEFTDSEILRDSDFLKYYARFR
jgi:hypothetical protein